MARVVLAVSSVLLAVIALCWIAAIALSFIDDRPRWVEPYVAWRSGPAHVYMAAVTRGGLSLESRALPWAPSGRPVPSSYEPDPDVAVQTVEGTNIRFSLGRFADRSLLGFAQGHWTAYIGVGRNGGTTNGSYVAVPIWFLLLVFGVLPGRAVVRWWRERRRASAGTCRVCGYDLRASPERCPECGTPRRVSLIKRLRAMLGLRPMPLPSTRLALRA